MNKALRHSTPERTLTAPELIEKAEQWRCVRTIRAGQQYSHYGLGPVQTGRAVVIAPPRWDVQAGCFVSEHYALDLVGGSCSCPDQCHIDGLQQDLRRAGLDWDAVGGQVLCKHFAILFLLRNAAAKMAPAPPASPAIRPVRSIEEIARDAQAQAARPYSETIARTATYMADWL